MNLSANIFILIALAATVAMYAVSRFFRNSGQDDAQIGSGLWFGLFGRHPEDDSHDGTGD